MGEKGKLIFFTHLGFCCSDAFFLFSLSLQVLPVLSSPLRRCSSPSTSFSVDVFSFIFPPNLGLSLTLTRHKHSQQCGRRSSSSSSTTTTGERMRKVRLRLRGALTSPQSDTSTKQKLARLRHVLFLRTMLSFTHSNSSHIKPLT